MTFLKSKSNGSAEAAKPTCSDLSGMFSWEWDIFPLIQLYLNLKQMFSIFKKNSYICVKFIFGLHVTKSIVHISVLFFLSLIQGTTIEHLLLLKTHSPFGLTTNTSSLFYSHFTIWSLIALAGWTSPSWSLITWALPNTSVVPLLFFT